MGLLADAIREHLELKRKHGAPDDEIDRAEQDALGPARRDPAAEPAGGRVPPLEGGAGGAPAGAPVAPPAERRGAGVPPIEEVPGDELPEAAIPPPPPPPAAEPPPVDDPVFADEY